MQQSYFFSICFLITDWVFTPFCVLVFRHAYEFHYENTLAYIQCTYNHFLFLRITPYS